ncbi:kinase-like domain-containing protein [Tribonema minus]|uniref:Kinase-like domain-containing protein n=1 Tax=Tribonema minus TaxID=303371 RepID=A0A835Z603_9STRA|nr:kinase-like domain-containing protein [Tribonema minus]
MFVGKYELLNLLGDGAFGQVRLGVHSDTGQRVAIKVMDVDRIKEQRMCRSVRREISVMKRLKHPNVLSLIEVLKSESHVFLVCELAEGGDLFDKIVDQDMFDEETTRTYFTQILDAMEYCHSVGICHRDLKPENILLAADGSIRVADFGFSRAFLDHGTVLEVYTRCGTPNFCAPEVLSGRRYDPVKADVWSLGVVLFVMLAGYLPFDDVSMDDLCAKIRVADFSFPHHVRALARGLVSLMLTADPSQRIGVADIRRHPWMARRSLSRRTCGRKLSTRVSLRRDESASRLDASEQDMDAGGSEDSFDAALDSPAKAASPSRSASSRSPPGSYLSVALSGMDAEQAAAQMAAADQPPAANVGAVAALTQLDACGGAGTLPTRAAPTPPRLLWSDY